MLPITTQIAQETTSPPSTALRQQAWNVAVYGYGTAAIFKERIGPLKKRLMWLKFIGLVIPVLVGTLVLTFGQGDYLQPVLIFVGVIGTGQAVFSIWALTSNWEESYAYAKESARHNTRIADQAVEVARDFHLDGLELKARVGLVVQEHRFRSEQDEVQDVTPAEMRMGLRVGLHQFQRACVTCKEIPNPSAPGKCSTCGL
jgi:mobilome CxxCx(11)CxxC protein